MFITCEFQISAMIHGIARFSHAFLRVLAYDGFDLCSFPMGP
jgi:hypothetical protein